MRSLVLLLALALGCGHSADGPDHSGHTATDGAAGTAPDAGIIAPADTAPADDAGCSIEEQAPPLEEGIHVAICGPVSHGSKPPSSGQHYGSWPLFRTYQKPVPWGFLVHGLEHGAVVIAYNCPAGCAADVAAIQEVLATIPVRPGCRFPPVIVTPDPTLDVPFAAAAWGPTSGHTLRATCFDRQRFAAFIEEYVNKGPENIPGDCGAIDREATGWCP